MRPSPACPLRQGVPRVWEALHGCLLYWSEDWRCNSGDVGSQRGLGKGGKRNGGWAEGQGVRYGG